MFALPFDEFKLALLMFAIFEGIVIFGVHLASVLIIRQVHKPVKKMTEIFYKSPKLCDFRLRWKLLLYIEHFTPYNKYILKNTITYGKYGQITYGSVSKVWIFFIILKY